MNIRRAVPADLPEIVRFVQSVLAETAAQKAGVLDDSFYCWQYQLARDLIVIAEEGGRVLAHYPLVEYPLIYEGRKLRAGVCQDLSVDASLRGRGIFRELGNVANQLALESGLDLLFAFPNHRSIGGFLKHHGYSLIGELGWRATVIRPAEAIPWSPLRALASLLPVAPALALVGRRATHSANSGPWDTHDLSALEDRFRDGATLRRPRTAEFLDWRFNQRPATSYWGIVEEENGRAGAWGVARTIEIKGMRVGLIMDLAMAPDGKPALGRVLGALRKRLANEGAALALMVDDRTLNAGSELLRAGFLPVPNRFAPRRLNLVARALRPELESAVNDVAHWSLTLADWDVF